MTEALEAVCIKIVSIYLGYYFREKFRVCNDIQIRKGPNKGLPCTSSIPLLRIDRILRPNC